MINYESFSVGIMFGVLLTLGMLWIIERLTSRKHSKTDNLINQKEKKEE